MEGSHFEILKDYVRLTRPANLLFIAILMWTMERWVAVPVLQHYWQLPEQMPVFLLCLLILSTVCIAAGGYVINDYFDVKIDRINRPDSMIVTQTISKESAMRFFMVLTAVGLIVGEAAAWCCRSTTLAIIFVMIPGLLWFYSASYKRQLIIGNLIVAFSSALTPFLIALTNEAWMRHTIGDVVLSVGVPQMLYTWIGGFAAFAFVMTWMREVVKDLQDQQGDRELECHTLPIVWGETWTKILVTIVALLVIGTSVWLIFNVLPFSHEWSGLSVRYWICAWMVPMVGELALLWNAKIPSDYKTAQQLLKWIMMMGTLYSFVIQASL